jgi:hypothetical protein
MTDLTPKQCSEHRNISARSRNIYADRHHFIEEMVDLMTVGKAVEAASRIPDAMAMLHRTSLIGWMTRWLA